MQIPLVRNRGARAFAVSALLSMGACSGRGSSAPPDGGMSGNCPSGDGPGSLVSMHVIDDQGEANAEWIARFDDGDAAVAGMLGTSTLATHVGDLEVPSGVHAFVARIAPDGALRWIATARFASASSNAGSIAGLAVDDANQVYLAGTFVDGLALGDEELVAADDAPDAFLASWASDGTFAWVDHITSEGREVIAGISARSSGVAIAGSVASSSAVGGEELAAAGAFVADLDAEGNARWVHRPLAEGGVLTIHATGSGPSEEVWLTAASNVPVDFGDGTPRGASARQWFVARYGSGGDLEAAESFGGEAEPTALSVDPVGGIAVGGSTYTDIDFGDEVLEAPVRITWIASLDAALQLRWAHRIGAETVQWLVIDASARVGVGGSTRAAEPFGAPEPPPPPPITSGRFINPWGFVVSYDADGSYRWGQYGHGRLRAGGIELIDGTLLWAGGHVNLLSIDDCLYPHRDNSDALVLRLRW